MAVHHELAFWVAVGLVGVVAVLLFKALGPFLPGPLKQLSAAA